MCAAHHKLLESCCKCKCCWESGCSLGGSALGHHVCPACPALLVAQGHMSSSHLATACVLTKVHNATQVWCSCWLGIPLRTCKFCHILYQTQKQAGQPCSRTWGHALTTHLHAMPDRAASCFCLPAGDRRRLHSAIVACMPAWCTLCVANRGPDRQPARNPPQHLAASRHNASAGARACQEPRTQTACGLSCSIMK